MAVNVLNCTEINQLSYMDYTCNCVAMSTTYSLVVSTGAFQHLCSYRCTHASTLKQTAVPDSIDFFAPMIPFCWHLPLQIETLHWQRYIVFPSILLLMDHS